MKRLLVNVLLFIFTITSCTTTSSLREDYMQKLTSKPESSHHRTYFVFLIDGLGYHNFIDYKNNMQNTVAFFQPKNSENFFPALSVIPSLTFPNVTSLLSGKKVYEHRVIGNKMLIEDSSFGGEIINWEDPVSAAKLNQKLGPMMIFNSLAEEGRTNVSLAYYFSEGSTAHLHKDLNLAKQVLNRDYLKVDRQTLFSLEKFLHEVPQEKWPEFLFVHLVSFDLSSHDFGPNNSYVQKKLQMLDLQLGRIYELLLAAEKKSNNVVSVLTSDHGFVDTPKYFDISDFINFTGNKAQVLSQSRVASVHFKSDISEDEISAVLKTISKEKRVALVVQKSIEGFNLIFEGIYYSFKFLREACDQYDYALVFRGEKFCPQEAEKHFVVPGAPYLVEQVSAYQRSSNAADALVFAGSGISFEPKQKGGHGGVSAYEMQPLVLLRNAKLVSPTDHFHLENLLDFITSGSLDTAN
jgi:hypothetical protein